MHLPLNARLSPVKIVFINKVDNKKALILFSSTVQELKLYVHFVTQTGNVGYNASTAVLNNPISN